MMPESQSQDRSQSEPTDTTELNLITQQQEVNSADVIKDQINELTHKIQVEQRICDGVDKVLLAVENMSMREQAVRTKMESEGRTRFLQEQRDILEAKLTSIDDIKFQGSNAEVENSFVGSDLMDEEKSDNGRNEGLDVYRASTGLTWTKIDAKIHELTYRLKMEENYLDGIEKMLTAWRHEEKQVQKGTEQRLRLSQSSSRDDVKAEQLTMKTVESALENLETGRDAIRQKILLLNQALKKYTSLTLSSTAMKTQSATSTPISTAVHQPLTESDKNINDLLLIGGEKKTVAFSGKMIVKVLRIQNIAGPNARPPFVMEVTLDRVKPGGKNNYTRLLLNPSPRPRSSSFTAASLSSSPATTSNSSLQSITNQAFEIYQESTFTLNRGSDLEVLIKSAMGSATTDLLGLANWRMAVLFPKGPNVEASVNETLEIEPSGSLQIQLHYIPEKTKSKPIGLERRPVIKRTQQECLGHQLISTQIFHLIKCTYCHDFIFNARGYECKQCHLHCHKKCCDRLFEVCIHQDREEVVKTLAEGPKEILDFADKFNIPHQLKLTTLGIPAWCGHCGQMVPLGRRVVYKCEECAIVWHDRCFPYVHQKHCGLDDKLIEAFVETAAALPNKSSSTVKTSIALDGSSQPIPIHKSRSKDSALFLAASTSPKLPTAMEPIVTLIKRSLSISKSLSSSSATLHQPQESIHDYELLKVLGKGNFGKVMLAKRRVTGEFFAIKMLKKRSILENDEIESVKSEKRIFETVSSTRHPFLVHHRSIFQDEHRVYFVMEFVGGGDLMFHIQNRKFDLQQCKFYAAQILLALEFLHSQNILYRDLKLDNILLGADGYVKLADYGLSKDHMTMSDQTRTFCGTPEFMAPEILLDRPYSLPVDFWAFGILLYQMLEVRSPFYGNNEQEIFESILKKPLVFSKRIDPDGQKLISSLVVKDPLERLGVKKGLGWSALKTHPFFAGINWSKLANKDISVVYRPTIRDPLDVANFDETFTKEEAILTPMPSIIAAAAAAVGGGGLVTDIFMDF